MNRRNAESALKVLLQQAVPPMGELAPEADLWPRLQQRLEETRPRVTKLDWLLAALALGLLVAFPDAVLLVLYHL